MRHDARPGLELGQEPRPELHVQIGQQIERDHRSVGELRLEEVFLAKLHQVGDAVLLRVLVRLLDALRVDVDAVGADAEALRRRDRDAAVAAPEVVEHVGLADLRELEHLVDDLLRRRDEDDIGRLRRSLRPRARGGEEQSEGQQ